MRRLGNQPAPTPVRETGPLDAVDAALAMASRRELVASDDALNLLHGVQAAVGNGAFDTRIAGIVADATILYSGRMTLDRCRLVDPLLDIRLAICN